MWLLTGILFAAASLATTGMADPRVLTLPSKVIVKGTRDSLPCQFEGTASDILWNKINSRDQISNIAILQNGVRRGPGIDNGRFNILDDFSLVIYDVTVGDELTYLCVVAEKETNVLYSNNTDVTVIAYAEQPILRIPQCQDRADHQGLNSQETAGCSVSFTASERDARLDCTVVGFKPNISLYWINAITNEKLDNIKYVYSTRSDGTYELTVSMKVNTRWVEQGGIVSCRADGMAVDGTKIKTVTIYTIRDAKPTDKSGTQISTLWKAGLSAICLEHVLFVIVWLLYKRRGQPQEQAGGNDRLLSNGNIDDANKEGSSEDQKHHTCIANPTSQPVFIRVEHGAGKSSSMTIDSMQYEAFATEQGSVKIYAMRNKNCPHDCNVTDDSDHSYIVKETSRGDLQLVHSDYGNVWKEGIRRRETHTVC